jgi:hypothetical protein
MGLLKPSKCPKKKVLYLAGKHEQTQKSQHLVRLIVGPFVIDSYRKYLKS